MSVKETYKVFMGDPRPNDALIGRLEPNQGHAIIKGTAQPAPAIGGMCMFANRSICWGRRLIKGKEVDRRVQPTDLDYSGEIKWMKWGAAGGSPITVRYKHGCNSIDYDYQITQLMLPKFIDDLEDNYLSFPFGENKIFYDSDAVKAEFLSVVHHNEDSISKSPEASGSMFHEVKLFDTEKKAVKQVDFRFEAVKLIKEANTYAKLGTLKTVVSQKKEIKFNEADENSLYESMMIFADENPEEFIGFVTEYKRKVSDLFELTKSFKAFDLTRDGVVRAGLSKMEDILTDIPAKGELMLDWMFQNCLIPEVHEGIDKLIRISQKFK